MQIVHFEGQKASKKKVSTKRFYISVKFFRLRVNLVQFTHIVHSGQKASKESFNQKFSHINDIFKTNGEPDTVHTNFIFKVRKQVKTSFDQVVYKCHLNNNNGEPYTFHRKQVKRKFQPKNYSYNNTFKC